MIPLEASSQQYSARRGDNQTFENQSETRKGRAQRPFLYGIKINMPARIANWGIELAFIRTKVGSEFQVAKSIAKTRDGRRCHFFGTYGYFDLVAIRPIRKVDMPYLVLLDEAIAESAPFRFFADQETHSQKAFENDLKLWPAAVLTFAKIHNPPLRQNGGEARWEAARRVRKTFPDTHVFLSMGYSELLLVSGGEDLAQLLARVTELRRLRNQKSRTMPLFAKTTTFPLISCSKVHSSKSYGKLKGEVDPVITGSCEPAFENLIVGRSKDTKLYARNVYGKSDFLLAWKEPVSVAKLAAFLSGLRGKWGKAGVLSKTTTYIETSLSPRELEKEKALPGLPRPSRQPSLMTKKEQKKLFELIRKVESHALRAALSDLTLRLSACLSDPQLGPLFRDMANTFPFMFSLVEHLAPGKSVKSDASFTAERIAHLARSAINQRYAGLEYHPETLAHTHLPLLCDIRTIVAAASCIPAHIFGRLIPGESASAIWSGFVLFGGEASPQILDQSILALPPASLFNPVEEWWKITHETAHAVFKSLDVYKKLPDGHKQHLVDALPEDLIDDYHLINELFANWFDWKYIFQGDTNFYLQMIWRSWIRLPVIHKSKSQYLARSFAVFICPRLGEFTNLLDRRWQTHGAPWIQNRWQEFRKLLLQIPGMRSYLDENAKVAENAMALVHHTTHILHFFEHSFERACGVAGLGKGCIQCTRDSELTSGR